MEKEVDRRRQNLLTVNKIILLISKKNSQAPGRDLVLILKTNRPAADQNPYCGGASSGVWGRNPRLNKERKQDSKSERSDNDRRLTKTIDRYVLNQQIAIARIQTRNGRFIRPRPNSRTHLKHRDKNIQLINS